MKKNNEYLIVKSADIKMFSHMNHESYWETMEDCRKGGIDRIVITLDAMRKNPSIEESMMLDYLDDGIRTVCLAGHLDPAIRLIDYARSISTRKVLIYLKNKAMEMAMRNGHLHIVKYLLDPQAPEPAASLDFDHSHGFVMACRNGQRETVKFVVFQTDFMTPEKLYGIHLYEDGDVKKHDILDMLEEKRTLEALEKEIGAYSGGVNTNGRVRKLLKI